MGILELAMKDANAIADKAFIDMALSELKSDIVLIEQSYNTVLVGDRNDFEKARRDWLRFTKMQVAFAVSAWRNGIFERYSNC